MKINNALTKFKNVRIRNSYRFKKADLADGLIAYYPFNGNANDESVNNNNGVVTGAVLTTDKNGDSNSAYFFDGNSDINTGTSILFDEAPDDFTISCWFYVDMLDFDGNIFTLIDNNGGTTGQNGYFIAIDDRGGISPTNGLNIISGGGGGASNIQINNVITMTGWYHLLFKGKANGPNTDVVVKINNVTQLDLLASGLRVDRDFPMQFGNDLSGTLGLVGKMDNIRFYNKSTTYIEDTALYNNYL